MRPFAERNPITRKNMRQLSSILVAAFVLVGTAQGRIGESEEQIRTRYGEAITILPSRTMGAGVTKCYSSHGLAVAVTYLNGQSVREMIAKADSSKITHAEIHSLLEANASGSSSGVQRMTGPETVTAGVQEWRTTDQRSRVAFYDSHTRALFITTQNFIDLTNAKKKQISMRDAGAFGARGRPQTNMKALERGSAITMRNGQPQPAATPASK
jgi:hypothetical protein